MNSDLFLDLLLILWAPISLIVIFTLARRAKNVQEQGVRRETELRTQVTALNQEVATLAPYRHIVDAQQEAARVRGATQIELETARQQANATTTAANEQAGQIVSSAHQEAQRIAGDALRVQQNVENYRREAKALENVISGYGDQYIMPAASLLDDLAESFGFAEAGGRLKEARDRTRSLLKAGKAATCEYVEANRRETAVAFVVDAFNGKVDSILSTVKEDNAGTLRQKILDAYTLVNMNGRAFRDARILDDYLQARLEELRWAAAAQELKTREKEEQRRIKEQIREEEKARREYERAQKEAAKEEDVIRRAMAKAQEQIAQATDAQRVKYEAQLQELALRLQAAEEKNQRALSMAQLTKRGHVYIISNIGSFGEDVFKIGLTRRLEPLDRIRELGDASVPFEFDVHALIISDDAPALERALHRHFLNAQLNKVNPRKEFFRATLTLIREEVEKLGIQASWTMAAAAVQYRESQAIERAIKNDPAAYQAWVDRQLVLDPVTVDSADEDDVVQPTPKPALILS